MNIESIGIMRCTFLFILLIGRSYAVCQELKFETIVEMGFGREDGKLGVHHSDSLAGGWLPNDVTIDTKENIFVADRLKERIIKFDPQGTWIQSFALPEEEYFDLKLTVDGDDNLHVALRSSEFLVGIYKLSSLGGNFTKLTLSGRQARGGDRLVGLFASRGGRLYLSTFPAEVLRANWENMTFAYTLGGEFLGMVDYSLEGSKGDAYKVEFKNGNRILSKYRLNPSNVLPTKLLEVARSNTFQQWEATGTHWANKQDFFLTGIDSLSRAYLSSEVLTRRYNEKLEIESEIPMSYEVLDKKYGIRLGHAAVRISPGGSVYAFGIKGMKEDKYRYGESEVTFVVLRFKETNR
jgi:hypothetical protein